MTGTEATPDPLRLEWRSSALERPGWAWRLYSRTLGIELWLVADAEAARTLDQAGMRAGLPVLLAADLDQFCATSPTASLRARLDTLAARNTPPRTGEEEGR
jgi:hypothetical protein